MKETNFIEKMEDLKFNNFATFCQKYPYIFQFFSDSEEIAEVFLKSKISEIGADNFQYFIDQIKAQVHPKNENVVGTFDSLELRYDRDYFTPLLKHYSLKYGLEKVEKISDETTTCLSMLQSQKIGLVFGQVQSGKTTNFTLLISKALSLKGTRAVVVLSGLTDDLRRQTQRRLELELVGRNSSGSKLQNISDFSKNMNDIEFITDESDFNNSESQRIRMAQSISNNRRMMFVVKKNSKVLEKLLTLLERTLHSDDCLYIVDDESDSATLNTEKDKSEKQSVINRLITNITHNSGWSVKYIAYTATPFANFLINSNDLNPLLPKFVQYISPGNGYQGMEKYFLSDNKDLISIIDDTFLKEEASFDNDAKFAIDQFLLESKINNRTNGILCINVTHLTDLQSKIKEKISEIIENKLKNNRDDFELKILEKLKENIFAFNSWEKEIFIDEKEAGVIIGGFKLSRGITIDRLSMFIINRASKDYDVILQQARWFGYREFAPKLLITSSTLDNFKKASEATKLLIDQILDKHAHSKEKTIDNLFIRCSKGLRLTSASKLSKNTKFVYENDTSKLEGNNFDFTSVDSDDIASNAFAIKEAWDKSFDEIKVSNTLIRKIAISDFEAFVKTVSYHKKSERFVDSLMELLNSKNVEFGYISIPNGEGEYKSSVDDRQKVRVKKSRLKNNLYTTTYSFKPTDFTVLDSRETSSIKRSSNDFLLIISEQSDGLKPNPIYISIEVGWGLGEKVKAQLYAQTEKIEKIK